MVPFPIVDTHLHVWDPQRLNYPWLSGILDKKYLLEDYREACGSVKVEKMVFLQCEVEPSQFLEEARWVSGLAKKDPRIQGIVPWAPLEKGDAARKDLDALTQDPLVKGIRRIIQFEEDLEFCLRPDFVRGVQLCAEYGLHFEICIDHRHYENTLKMVEQCPNVTFLLNHIGKPDIKNKMWEHWTKFMDALAAFPKAWCKMSGLVVEADKEHWTPEDLKPYIDHVLKAFGWDRTVFGGDWPVVLQASRLDRWVETLYNATKSAGEEKQRKLFHDNAITFYRLAR